MVATLPGQLARVNDVPSRAHIQTHSTRSNTASTFSALPLFLVFPRPGVPSQRQTRLVEGAQTGALAMEQGAMLFAAVVAHLIRRVSLQRIAELTDGWISDVHGCRSTNNSTNSKPQSPRPRVQLENPQHESANNRVYGDACQP